MVLSGRSTLLMRSIVAQSPINIGKKAVDIALNVLDGKDFEAETAIDVFMINKDNVEMYGADGWQ